MTNLLEETIRVMAVYDKTWDDISWVGGDDFCIDLTDYIAAAKNTNYDCGYGSEEIATDLVICFKDGSWLSRESYDGSEWFKYNAYPQKPEVKFGSNNLKLSNGGHYDYSLKAINYP